MVIKWSEEHVLISSFSILAIVERKRRRKRKEERSECNHAAMKYLMAQKFSRSMKTTIMMMMMMELNFSSQSEAHNNQFRASFAPKVRPQRLDSTGWADFK